MNRDEAVKKIAKAGGLSLFYAEDLYDSIIPKPTVPQYVADWVANSREYDYEFCDFFDCNNQSEEVYRWLNCENRRQSELNALALSVLIVNGRDAVIIEEEPRYKVRIRNLNAEKGFLNYDNVGKAWEFNNQYNTNEYKTIHTRKELEANGFGWVFDCEGIAIEEVEE